MMRRFLLIGGVSVACLLLVGAWWVRRDDSSRPSSTEATATTPAVSKTCGDRVLADARDNGRIDLIYPARCYRLAIDLLPDGTPARDEIKRAQSFSHSAPPSDGKTD